MKQAASGRPKRSGTRSSDGRLDQCVLAAAGRDDETLRVLIDAPTEGRLLIDAEGIILALNDRACERLSQLSGQRLGRRPERLIGLCIYDLFPPDLAVERRERNDQVLSSGKIVHFEDERDGRWMENTICPIFRADGQTTGLAVLSRDITDLKDAQRSLRDHARELERANQYLTKTLARLADSEEQLARALEIQNERARRDPLTGVLNRTAIVEELDRIMSGDDQRVAVAVIDVDHMKPTNDRHGHHVGDAVLSLVARVLVRDSALVGRYGGDEFIALLEGADRERANAYQRRVQRALARARLNHDGTGEGVRASVSIGVALCPDDSGAAGELIRLADSAMYAARRLRQLEASSRRGKKKAA